MEPADYVRAVRRHWRLILALAVIGLGVGYVTAPKPAPAPAAVHSSTALTSYQALTVLSTSSPSADPTGLSLDAMAYLATTGPVANATAKAIGGGLTGSEVASQVQVAAKDPLGVIQVTATAPTTSGAVDLANSFSAQLIAALNAQLATTAQSTVAANNAQLATLNKVINTLQAQTSSSLQKSELAAAQSQYVQLALSNEEQQVSGPPHTGLHVVAPAQIATAAVVGAPGTIARTVALTSSKKVRLGLGGLAGLLVGIAVALVWDGLDKRVRTTEQAAKAFGLPVLGELPDPGAEPPGDTMLARANSKDAESYRMLQTSLFLARTAGPIGSAKTILLSSPIALGSKTAVVANLAASFADAGATVALIPADPAQTFAESISEDPGPVAPPAKARRRSEHRNSPANTPTNATPTVLGGVYLIGDSAGMSRGGSADRYKSQLVESGRSLAEVVLVDAAPVLESHEATGLSATVDLVVLLVGVGTIKAKQAALATESLRRVGAPLHGVIVVAQPSMFRRLKSRRHTRTAQPKTRSRSTRARVPATQRQYYRADANATGAGTSSASYDLAGRDIDDVVGRTSGESVRAGGSASSIDD